MRNLLLSLLLLAATALHAQRLLTTAYASRLDSLLLRPGTVALLPCPSGRLADSLPAAVRQSYIAYAERYAGKPWVSLPATVFAEFKTNGNRTRYEQLCFAKRRQLAALVMGELVERNGRFVPDIVDGLQSLCEETWWGIPAHYKTALPQTANQEVDLFNAETAGLVAWTRHVLAARLDAFSPLLAKRIDSELSRRILQPALKGRYWWKTAGMNWNPWICSNWLACVLAAETDRARQVEAVRQVMQCLDAFVDAYPADGGCDEGPGYWDRAAASLADCLYLLHLATGGRVDIRQNPKVRAMMQYIYKMYIGNGYCVNFADAHSNRMPAQLNVVLPMSRYFADGRIGQLADMQMEQWQRDAAALYDGSGNFPTLGRELTMLAAMSGVAGQGTAQGDGKSLFQALNPAGAAGWKTPSNATTWLPDLQIATFHRGPLFAAMKGGTNGESHNHNDVGSFIVYADQEPLLIDPGVGEYTAKTFSRQRYDIWTMQSAYHNLPTVNGRQQRDGKQYHARNVRCGGNVAELDLAPAYPPEAALKRWTRRVEVTRRAVSVSEDYELTALSEAPVLNFITTVRPDLSTPGIVRLGRRRIEYDPRQLTAGVDSLGALLDDILRRQWGSEMYRLRLTVKDNKLKNNIKYQVK